MDDLGHVVLIWACKSYLQAWAPHTSAWCLWEPRMGAQEAQGAQAEAARRARCTFVLR